MMTKPIKRKYVKPAMQVYLLSPNPRILAGSGEGGLDDYNRPNNPYNW